MPPLSPLDPERLRIDRGNMAVLIAGKGVLRRRLPEASWSQRRSRGSGENDEGAPGEAQGQVYQRSLSWISQGDVSIPYGLPPSLQFAESRGYQATAA